MSDVTEEARGRFVMPDVRPDPRIEVSTALVAHANASAWSQTQRAIDAYKQYLKDNNLVVIERGTVPSWMRETDVEQEPEGRPYLKSEVIHYYDTETCDEVDTRTPLYRLVNEGEGS